MIGRVRESLYGTWRRQTDAGVGDLLGRVLLFSTVLAIGWMFQFKTMEYPNPPVFHGKEIFSVPLVAEGHSQTIDFDGGGSILITNVDGTIQVEMRSGKP